jgi:hypothetical protein
MHNGRFLKLFLFIGIRHKTPDWQKILLLLHVKLILKLVTETVQWTLHLDLPLLALWERGSRAAVLCGTGIGLFKRDRVT